MLLFPMVLTAFRKLWACKKTGCSLWVNLTRFVWYCLRLNPVYRPVRLERVLTPRECPLLAAVAEEQTGVAAVAMTSAVAKALADVAEDHLDVVAVVAADKAVVAVVVASTAVVGQAIAAATVAGSQQPNWVLALRRTDLCLAGVAGPQELTSRENQSLASLILPAMLERQPGIFPNQPSLVVS